MKFTTHTNRNTRIVAIILAFVMLALVPLANPAYAAEIDMNTYLLDQRDYPHINYGDGDVSHAGCGIVSLTMVVNIMRPQLNLDVATMARVYGPYYGSSSGSAWELFTQGANCGKECRKNTSAETMNALLRLNVKQVFNGKAALEELNKGNLIISCQNGKESLFTNGGHYIMLYGMENDKVGVLDPYGGNYEEVSQYENSKVYVRNKGFEEGFTIEQIERCCSCFFVFSYEEDETVIANAVEVVASAKYSDEEDEKVFANAIEAVKASDNSIG